MKTFKIEVKETLAAIHSVQAETREEAIANIKNQYLNQEIILDTENFVQVEFQVLEDCSLTYTKDTKRLLKDGDSLFYNEWTGEWYDSWLAMVHDAWYKGMTKAELAIALDTEHTDCYLFYTSYERDC
ncbi:DpnD/PcfM family protein [Lysinibacillus sp. KU-BSD001]|uniref:DpnD/PcfM family protein n=1 Tax=Lysinibacillus sp. KU-BSD001 TaxID=3141328 RepID=UPI0036F08467